jgi:gamma-glutamyl-gamma-aminobutyrate hydrolase PuuD
MDPSITLGGAAVNPSAWDEVSLRPKWAGDRILNRYEMELPHEFLECDKPVPGRCCGCQFIHVALKSVLSGQQITIVRTYRPRW